MTLLDAVASASMTPNVLGAILGDLITFAAQAILIGGGVFLWRWRKRKHPPRVVEARLRTVTYECARCGTAFHERTEERIVPLAKPSAGANGSSEPARAAVED